jgi:hypothetical protein
VVTVGECVDALLLTMLTGEHTCPAWRTRWPAMTWR